jgi:hypothetical protein
MNALNTNSTPETQEWQVNNYKNTFLEKVSKLKVVIPAAVLGILLSSGVATAWEYEDLDACIARSASLGEKYEALGDRLIDLELCNDQVEGLEALKEWQEARARAREIENYTSMLNAASAPIVNK